MVVPERKTILCFFIGFRSTFQGAFPVKTLGGYTLEHCHDFFLEHQKMGGDCTDFKLSGLEVNRPWLPGIFSNVSYTDG